MPNCTDMDSTQDLAQDATTTDDEQEDLVTYEETEELEDEDPNEILDELFQSSSGLPVFDKVVANFRTLLTNPSNAEAAALVEESWSKLEAEMGELANTFQQGLPFQEKTTEVIEAGTSAFDQLEWMQAQFKRFQEGFKHGDCIDCAYALRECHRSLTDLFTAFEQLKKTVDTTAYSERPIVSELIRVARLVQQQKLPPSALDARLQTFCDVADHLQSLLTNAKATPGEASVLESLKTRYSEAVELQNRGIDSLYDFLQDGEDQQLEGGLRLIESATPVFVELQSRLSNATGVGESRPCPFCSASNEPTLKFCCKCNARLPESGQFVQASSANFREGAEGGPGENFQELAAAVEQFKKGQSSPEEFAAAVDKVRKLHERGVQMMLNLKTPPTETPTEQLRLFEETKSEAEEGLDSIDEGLADLEAVVDGELGTRGRNELLTSGVNSVMSGAEQLNKITALFQQATAMGSTSSP